MKIGWKEIILNGEKAQAKVTIKESGDQCIVASKGLLFLKI